VTKHGNIAARIKVVLIVVFFVAIWLGHSMYDLQIVNHDKLLEKAKETVTKHKTFQGKRGEIYDYNGHLLVGNIPVKEIGADPSVIDRITKIPEQIALIDTNSPKRVRLSASIIEIATRPEVKAIKDSKKKVAAILTLYFRKILNLSKSKAKRVHKELLQPYRLDNNGNIRYDKPPEDPTRKGIPDQWMDIARDVDFMLACKIEKELKKAGLAKGLVFNQYDKRHYPKNELLANVLGFTNNIENTDRGMAGLESQLNLSMASHKSKTSYISRRSGIPLATTANKNQDEQSPPDDRQEAFGESIAEFFGFSTRKMNVDNTGIEIDEEHREIDIDTKTDEDGIPLAYGVSDTANVINGDNVYLTIEEPVQAIVEEELDKLMEKWNPRAAYAIMADPYTGNILAMAQRPSFNPNDRSTYTAERYRNRMTEDTFEPGSTMKPIAISRAIDDNLVTPDTIFDCEGGWWHYGGAKLKDSHAHDKLSVAEIIQVSSNIGTAKIALQMGNKRLHDTLTGFGFTQRTGIPLKNETRGLLRPLKKWYRITPTRVCIGQSINTSPLQLVRGYCALANNGILPELRLVDRIENPSTKTIKEIPYAPVRQLYKSSKTHKKMIDMMKLVTQEGGTATKVAIDGYYVAGKTGTSQKYITGEGYSNTKYFATFVGFVPADNPKFVLLVTADEPERSHYGGTVSGPAFKSISEKTLKYYNIQPDYYRK